MVIDVKARKDGAVAGTIHRAPRGLGCVWAVGRVWAVGCVLAVGIAVIACSAPDAPAPRTQLPEGSVFAGDAEAFRRLLAAVELLRGSPIGRGAGVLRGRLAECDEFSASLAAGESFALADLFDTASCDRKALDDPALSSLRGESDLVFVLPVGQQGRIAGRVQLDDAGSLAIEAEFLELSDGQLVRLLTPDSGALGARRLSDEGALLSARFRPEGGLDLAALVPRGSQADQMFRLRSAIFQGAALSGAWEFALYPPSEGGALPLLALSVDVRLAAAARAGMREFIGELEATWPVHHSAAQFGERGEYAGACFFDLRIMPEFAPCYAETPTAIVLGWNPEAIQRALAGSPGVGGLDVAMEAGGSPEIGPHAAELVVSFAALSEADDRLRSVLAPETSSLELEYFWDRLAVVSGRRDSSAASIANFTLGFDPGSGTRADPAGQPALQAALQPGSPGAVWLRARLRAAQSDRATQSDQATQSDRATQFDRATQSDQAAQSDQSDQSDRAAQVDPAFAPAGDPS